jgi:protein phosphatase
MSALSLRRRGGRRLLANRCPNRDYGFAFSGMLTTGRGVRVFRGFVRGGRDYLSSIIGYCVGVHDNVPSGVEGYAVVSGRGLVLMGGFRRSDVRGMEYEIDVDEVKRGIFLTPYSETGGAGSANEDSAIKVSIRDCANGYLWYIGAVADGVGGFNRGDVASEITVKEFTEIAIANLSSISGGTLSDIVWRIHDTLYSNYTGRGVSLGSTLAAVVINRHEDDEDAAFHAVNVGDTRIYHIYATGESGGWIDELSVSDKVSGHVISQAIGYMLREVHVTGGGLKPGDYLVLVTDGVSDVMDRESIKDITITHKYPWDSSRALVKVARGQGSQDDATALVVWFKG